MAEHRDAIRQTEETIAWCTWRSQFGRPCDSLRFTWLRPPCLSQTKSEPERVQAVQRLAGQRRALLSTYPGSPHTVPRLNSDLTLPGNLLLYFPDETLFDGAAEVASQGLFDSDNEPPWDTWILYNEGETALGWSHFLLAWIPHRYVSLAEAGVAANPEGCIRLLPAADLNMIRTLSID